jgi:clathrin heavy chain
MSSVYRKIAIIDLANANNVLHRFITANSKSAIMHPKQKILALKGKLKTQLLALEHVRLCYAARRTLQIFNIKMKQKVKSHVNNKDIVFWKSVWDTRVGMVTDMSVFHRTISDATSHPKKYSITTGAQIINY